MIKLRFVIEAIVAISMGIGLFVLYRQERRVEATPAIVANPEPPCDFEHVANLTRACTAGSDSDVTCLNRATSIVCPWIK